MKNLNEASDFFLNGYTTQKNFKALYGKSSTKQSEDYNITFNIKDHWGPI